MPLYTLVTIYNEQRELKALVHKTVISFVLFFKNKPNKQADKKPQTKPPTRTEEENIKPKNKPNSAHPCIPIIYVYIHLW